MIKKLMIVLLFAVSCLCGCAYLPTDTSSQTTIATTGTTASPTTTTTVTSDITTTTSTTTSTYTTGMTTLTMLETTLETTLVSTTQTQAMPVILSAPTGLVEENGILSWNEVEFCLGYQVMVDGIIYPVSANQFSLENLPAGMHNIKVKAIGNNENHYSSSYSPVMNYEVAPVNNAVHLSEPQNMIVSGAVVSWDLVTDAISYVIQINNGASVTVSSNHYDLGSDIPGTYEIKVYARGNGVTILNSGISSYIHEIHAALLPGIADLTLTGNVLSWTGSENASSYLVKINDETINVGNNNYQLTLEDPGLYQISVQALGDNLYFLDSSWSEAILYEISPEPVYITTDVDKLYLGTDEFRFVSFNVPNLLILEDPDWHMIDPWEQQDAIDSVRLMGGRVIRTYTLSIIGGIRPLEGGNQLAHIMGIGNYNEALFQSMDKAIQLAGEAGVYLIIPFIDEWNWFGGVAEFSALYGKTKNQFFTDTGVRQGFKNLISFVLNRVNTYTGVRYKDDPAILAWELGNELRSATDTWIGEMAAYIKSIDDNHLVMSGRDKVTTYDLNNVNVDIVSAHYYTNNGTGTFADRAKADRLLSVGKKPFIIGEYGLVDASQLENLIIESVQNGTSGSLIWSLRFRNVNGGFYYHIDSLTRAYHYPGFSVNDDYFETRIVSFICDYAFRASGLGTYAAQIPEAPHLFPVADGFITWRGATGTQSFTIERCNLLAGDWEVIASSLSDAFIIGPFYLDNTLVNGISYEYRIQGVNAAGQSEYSNVVSYMNP